MIIKFSGLNGDTGASTVRKALNSSLYKIGLSFASSPTITRQEKDLILDIKKTNGRYFSSNSYNKTSQGKNSFRLTESQAMELTKMFAKFKSIGYNFSAEIDDMSIEDLSNPSWIHVLNNSQWPR